MNFYTDVSRKKDTLLVRGYYNGERFKDEVEYKPYLFLEDQNGEYKTLTGVSVTKKIFKSISNARWFIKTQKEFANASYYGNDNFLYQYIYEEYRNLQYDLKCIKTNIVDIEVSSRDGFPNVAEADKEITAITVVQGQKVLAFGLKPFFTDDPNITYVQSYDERTMLINFLNYWNTDEWMPDVFTGWYCGGFDVPYLVNRINRIVHNNAANALSPWRIVEKREYTSKGRLIETYNIAGIQILDYQDLYRKFTFKNHESYKLENVCQEELGEGKVDYGEFKSLDDLYDKDFQKFITYNIKDCILISKLNNKLGFLELVFTFGLDAKINFIDTLTTVNPWDIISTNYLMDKKIVVNPFTPPENEPNIIGGYCKEPYIGLSRWVISFDFTSLYPHLMMTFNISPETYIHRISDMPSIEQQLNGALSCYKDFLKEKNYSITANGCLFKKDFTGFLPELMQKLFNDRVLYKNKLKEAKKKFKETKDKQYENEITIYDNLQLAKKIQLNACYGAVANRFFRHFNENVAESVTSTGQFVTRYVEKTINKYLNTIFKTDIDYVVASDTDSVYITLEHLVREVGLENADNNKIADFIDKIAKEKLDKVIKQCLSEIFAMTNAHAEKLFLKREKICNKAIWRGKKMYALNVIDNEGERLSIPENVFHGIEAVRSSTPNICRKKIKEAIKIILNKEEGDLQDYVADFEKEFYTLPFEDIAFPRGANDIVKYSSDVTIFKERSPIHVAGSLVYNHYLSKLKLDNKYEKIYNGSKVRFVYLRLPNPLKSHVIASLGKLPEEFDIERFIDYKTQFEKTFLNPILSFTSIIGWKVKKEDNLSEFFN